MMKQFNNHVSVLFNEAIESLNIKKNGIYVDCTFGRGGHAKRIDELLEDGTIIVIDKDLEAINYANQLSKSFKNKLIIVHDDFNNIKSILAKYEINSVDGFLFDLGISSPQLDDPTRGFSYNKQAVIDMRMDQTKEFSAKDVLNQYSLEKLVEIFKKYGDCKDAYKVANAIIKYRQVNQIETTDQLVEIIRSNVNKKTLNDKNPSKAYFQAIRIEVNNEIDLLNQTISFCCKKLNKYGRVCVITFHSIEDKIVKSTFNELINENKLPAYLPVKDVCDEYKVLKPIVPSENEKQINKRSRSAKLRIIERL